MPSSMIVPHLTHQASYLPTLTRSGAVATALPSHPHVQLAHVGAIPLGIINRLGIEEAMPSWGPVALVVAANIITLKVWLKVRGVCACGVGGGKGGGV
jgi:hypothetical protein